MVLVLRFPEALPSSTLYSTSCSAEQIQDAEQTHELGIPARDAKLVDDPATGRRAERCLGLHVGGKSRACRFSIARLNDMVPASCRRVADEGSRPVFARNFWHAASQ